MVGLHQGRVDGWGQGAVASGLLTIQKENREVGGAWAWLKDRGQMGLALGLSPPSHAPGLHVALSAKMQPVLLTD